jgi:hypothetical protein
MIAGMIHRRYPTATAANIMISAITSTTIVILKTFIKTSFLCNHVSPFSSSFSFSSYSKAIPAAIFFTRGKYTSVPNGPSQYSACVTLIHSNASSGSSRPARNHLCRAANQIIFKWSISSPGFRSRRSKFGEGSSQLPIF